MVILYMLLLFKEVNTATNNTVGIDCAMFGIGRYWSKYSNSPMTVTLNKGEVNHANRIHTIDVCVREYIHIHIYIYIYAHMYTCIYDMDTICMINFTFV